MKLFNGRPPRKDFVKAAQGFSPTVLSMPHSGTTLYILYCTALRNGSGRARARKDFAWARKACKPKNVYSMYDGKHDGVRKDAQGLAQG